jgi:hypothetical protein
MFSSSYSFSRLLLLLLQTSATSANLYHHWGASDKFLVTNGDDRDRLGVEVEAYGDIIAVGADGDSDRGNAAGAVYMYRKVGRHFRLQDKLLGLNSGQNDAFGSTFSLRDDIIAVGAPRNGDTQFGAVHIFRYMGDNDWQETQELLAPDPADQDFFGFSVEFFGDSTLLIGAPGVGSNVGKFYVYRDNGTGDFIYDADYAPADGSVGQQFGNHIATDGQYAVIGSNEDDDNGAMSGSAYIYKSDDNGDTFALELKLVPDDGQSEDEFGYRVAISNSSIAIGAPKDDDNFIGRDAGSVYTYEYNEMTSVWEFDEKITRTTVYNRLTKGAEDDFFGSSLSLDGDYLAVGAPGADRGLFVQNAGTAHIYKRRSGRARRNRGTWKFEDSVSACENSAGDNFGYSVSLDMSTKTLAVGSLEGGGIANDVNPGAAFVYRRGGFRFVNQFLCRFFY